MEVVGGVRGAELGRRSGDVLGAWGGALLSRLGPLRLPSRAYYKRCGTPLAQCVRCTADRGGVLGIFSHISASATCFARKVCGPVRSTWGTSRAEDELGARDKIVNTKVARRACAGRTPGNRSPLVAPQQKALRASRVCAQGKELHRAPSGRQKDLERRQKEDLERRQKEDLERRQKEELERRQKEEAARAEQERLQVTAERYARCGAGRGARAVRGFDWQDRSREGWQLCWFVCAREGGGGGGAGVISAGKLPYFNLVRNFPRIFSL